MKRLITINKINRVDKLDVIGSYDNYLWDIVPIANIDSGMATVTAGGSRQFVALFRDKNCGAPLERHYGSGHLLLDYSNRFSVVGELRKPDMHRKIGSRPITSYHTGSYYKLSNGYFAVITVSHYTGEGFVQEIVPMISKRDIKDLTMLNNHSLSPDDYYYSSQVLIPGTNKSSSFRDPFIYKEKNEYKMIFSATNKKVEPPYSACIGMASSMDLIKWVCEEPLFISNDYIEMDVPQIINIGKDRILLFSTKPTEYRYGDKYDTTIHAFLLSSNNKKINVDVPPEIFAVRYFHVKGNEVYAMGIIENHELEGTFTVPFVLKYQNNTLSFSPFTENIENNIIMNPIIE